MNKKTVALAFTIPLLILLLLTIQPLLTVLWGQEITLETVPVDPVDLFRGDYVRLEYKINTVNVTKMPEQLNLKEPDYRQLNSRQLYAVLKKTGDYDEVDYITLDKPKDQLYIKCNFDYFTGIVKNSSTGAHVNYHLDRYFVAENTGTKLEEQSRKGDVVARVKVFHGYALVVGVGPR